MSMTDEQLWGMVQSMDGKLDKIVKSVVRTETRVDSHAIAIRWIFGILGTVIAGTLVTYIAR
jgi:hypothetical protein